jgi:tetratricopeptide (TPR) repeat protein
MAFDPPKVLISYSHDSLEHEQRVLILADRLRADGVDCMIDQYILVPEEGWPLWMQRQIRDSKFVLMVCTETYLKRVLREEQPGKGFGVCWEANLIYNAIYSAGMMNTKFIPVLFESGHLSHIPDPLRHTCYYDLSIEDGYENLYRRLTNQPKVTKKDLAESRNLLPSERKSEEVLCVIGEGGALSNLPERNLFFTGREDVLAQLQEALTTQGRAALSGLGGMGKSQTAVEYAHHHLAEYTNAFWAIADSREALVSGYVKIASLLKLPEASAEDQEAAAGAVKCWLGSHEGWLLILDNADNLVIAREFIPSGKNGHALLTTRAGATGAVARRVEIQEMGTEEGSLFLLRRAKYIVEDSPLNAAAEADQAAAKEIVTQLDGLPLALDQAGAYIEETSCGLSGYLNLCRSHTAELLRRRGRLSSDHLDPVSTTWALSFESIQKANPAAAELLRFCAFLHPDAIPEEVFSEGATELGPELGVVASDPLAWNDALSEILKYSLLRRDPYKRTLEIHRLVQAVLKQAMDEANRRLWAERAVRTVNRAFPGVEFSTWAVCDRLLPHAHACAELINQWGFEFPDAARMLNQAGFYSYERGRYADAEPLLVRALAIRENVASPGHPDVATSLNNLAELYRDQGQYTKAECLHKRALAIREKALDPEHPDVAKSLNNLAWLYYKQDRYAEADCLNKRALAIWKKALGSEHPDVAKSLNGLAASYQDQGQYAKAECLHKRALAIREKALGPEHPDVALSLNNLAWLYYTQGQYEKAEPLYPRALAIFEKALGSEHPDLALSFNNLAELYRAQGQYAKAEPLLERALVISEKALGSEHRDVAQSLYNLAELSRSRGRYAKAEPLYGRALAIWEKALGPEHPDVANSLNNLAGLYDTQGQYGKAEPLYQRALAILEKALGPEHPNVATNLENYALCLRATNRSQEAELLESRAKAIRAKTV